MINESLFGNPILACYAHFLRIFKSYLSLNLKKLTFFYYIVSGSYLGTNIYYFLLISNYYEENCDIALLLILGNILF